MAFFRGGSVFRMRGSRDASGKNARPGDRDKRQRAGLLFLFDGAFGGCRREAGASSAGGRDPGGSNGLGRRACGERVPCVVR